MKKIIALLMALSLLILSGITVSGKSSKPTNYPGQSKAADIIVEAIKANDADEIVAMFNSESQEGIKDLHQKIENFIAIIGSDIISHDSTGSYQSDKIDLGYRYSEVGFDITIITESQMYKVGVSWITKCSSDSEKVGIDAMTLFLLNKEERMIDFWETISLPFKESVTYKKELDLLRDPGAIAHYNSLGYDSVVFTSSDESVVTVNSGGFATPKGPGTVIVTETLTNTKTGKVVETEYEITVKLSFWQKIIWYCLFGFLWY